MIHHTFVAVSLLALTIFLPLLAEAHGHDFQGAELLQYRRSYALKHRSLNDRCGDKLRRRRLHRAAAMIETARRQQQEKRRETSGALSTRAEIAQDDQIMPLGLGRRLFEHYTKRQDNDSSSDSSSSSNSSACLLTPEVTQGPYHILGELVQQDIRSGQPGIPLHLLVDFVDVDTCEPLSNAWVDVWSANATGFYSGYEASSSMTGEGGAASGGNSSSSGNSTLAPSGSGSGSMALPTMTVSANASLSGSATAAASGTGSMSAGGMGGGGAGGSVNSATIDSYTAGADRSSNGTNGGGGGGGGGGSSGPTDEDNFLRGVWQTDDDGLLTMFTVVPGWYSGRAPHTHIKVYSSDSGYRAENGSFIANGTGLAHHTGQWFFDDDIMAAVAATEPYKNNKIAWDNATKNSDDGIYPYANSMGTKATMDITYIDSSDIYYGLIGSTTVGINMTYSSAELTTFYWDPEPSTEEDTSASSTSSAAATSTLSGASSTDTSLADDESD